MAETLIAAGTNRSFFHEMATSAPREAVWTLWTTISSWKDWDLGLKDAELDGALRLGAVGHITPQSGPPAKFRVIEFEERVSYAFATTLPLAKLVVRRSFLPSEGTVFRHDVSFTGLLAGLWAGQLGPGFRKALPPTMERLARQAEKTGQ